MLRPSLVFLAAISLLLATPPPAFAGDGVRLSQFGAGDGPSVAEGVYRVLDAAGTKSQSNAIAFPALDGDVHLKHSVRCKLRVNSGGDGGAFAFLNTSEYGADGPAPFVKSWVEPNLKQSLAIAIDVHNPKNEEMFGPWGNYRGMPEREVSVHWDGREIVKRVAAEEFRDQWTDCEIRWTFVAGGALVTVRLAGAAVFDEHFVPGVQAYAGRLAVGAGTRADATTAFDFKDLKVERSLKRPAPRAPSHFEVFNHVLTNNKKTAYEASVTLPPRNWEFGRVIMTIEIHDAGPNWDEWDRNGEVSLITEDGKKLGIVPFITSYRTTCFWQVDVTHFRPWLAGKTKFEIRAGTTFYKNRGYMMSMALDFHHGHMRQEPYRIEPLWLGTARYKTAENHFQDFFTPREIAIDASMKRARLFTTTTGHSQIGEFTPSKRAIVCNETRFTNTLWRDDCYLNPNRPQFGTWKFSRAGWAPGDVVRPWILDVTKALEGAQLAAVTYETQPYDFTGAPKPPAQKEINKASHVVRSYLVFYREPEGLMAPPALLITGVARGSAARKAGLLRGDYLASYDGKPLNNLADLRAAIQGAAKAGKNVAIVAYRGARKIEVELAPGRMGVNLSVQ